MKLPGETSGDWNPAEETHSEWRKRRARELQRYRRSQLRRIDYYPCPEANAVIAAMRGPYVGRDASRLIDGMVIAWAERSGTNYREIAEAIERRDAERRRNGTTIWAIRTR